MMPKWCHERFLFVVAYKGSFFGSGLLELYQASPWLRCGKHCFPWGNAHFSGNASMPRCSCAKPAFIKNQCRFGSFLKLQSGLEMALACNGNGMGRSIDFGMLFGAILPPTWVPLGSMWASVGPHWAPSWPHLSLIGPHLTQILTPLGPCQLHGHLTRAHLSSIRAPAAHLSII